MQTWQRFFIPLWAFLSLSLGASDDYCTDELNQPISSCGRCLWRPDCHWCPTKISELARGCIKRAIPCSDTPIQSRPSVRQIMAKPIAKENWISPQQVQLNLSPQTPGNVTFQAQLFDLPVDIYFLMDLSNSMTIHKTNLVNAADEIAQEVMSLTSDYRFGFGSFSDKPTPPFASELSTYKTMQNRNQPPPYSFHHHVSMTSNATAFKKTVENSPLAGNVDSPESGMDALMQVLACDEVIGWRQDVRKVIILITDEDTHFAYDGYLGGITIPNDGECHLTLSEEGDHHYYDKQLEMDYPSFGHVADKMSQKNVALIFAVDEYMQQLYKDLSKFLQGTSNVGLLAKEASSLTSIVTQQYRQIKSRLALQASTDIKNLDLKLTGDKCENPTPTSVVCSNVAQGQSLEFQLQITAKEDLCQNPSDEHRVMVSIVGSSNHQMTVNLNCEHCNCDDGARFPNAPQCKKKGTFHCGGCLCDENHVGRSCQCELTQTSGDLTETCIERGQAIPCNGRGDCNCGVCQCQGKYRGDFCQCHVDQCPTKMPGNPCSGHGHCSCDKDSQTTCTCYEGWSGSDCGCAQNFDACQTKFTRDPCMGRGTCVCGECQCQSGFYGKYCQKSTSMTTCEKLEPCVKLRAFKLEDEDADEIHAEWLEECKSNLFMGAQYVFGGMQNVLKACQNNLDESSMIFDPSVVQDFECEDLLKRYELEQLERKEVRPESSGHSNFSKRGDTNIWSQERILLTDTSNMERCVGYKDRCAFSFYHDNIEADKYFSLDPEKDPGKVLVAFRNVSGTYQAITSCTVIPMAVIVGSSIGLLLLSGIVLLITAIVIVNINDLRRWKQYQAWKAENERQLGEQDNPLYESKSTTFQNPSFNS